MNKFVFFKALFFSLFFTILPLRAITLEENKCRICHFDTTFLFEKLIRKKYQGRYFLCKNCGSLQLKDPVWLEETYSEKATFSDLDPGRTIRIELVAKEIKLLKKQLHIKRKLSILDYGAGEGILKKISLDNVTNFDPYFNYSSLEEIKKNKYDLIVCIEVLEHLENVSEFFNLIKDLADKDTMILCSTELINKDKIDPSWWYFTPDIGAHITFWSEKSFEHMKNILDYQNIYHFQCNFLSFHLLSNKPIKVESKKGHFFSFN